MRLIIALFLSLLSTVFLGQVHACPPGDEEIARVMTPLKAKFDKDICGQGIKPGGAKDVEWVKLNLLPYYISKKWLTKEPPKGWEKEVDNLIKKCHKNSYNYCLESDRKQVGECVKGKAGSLMLKYGATAMSFCPIFDKILEDWSSKHEATALSWFSAYCKTKGKVC